MGSFTKILFAGLIGVSTASGASAQTKQPPATTAPKPQPGTSALPGTATKPTTVGPGMIGQSPWFTNQNVSQHLQFSNDQIDRMNRAYGDAWSSYQKRVNGLGITLTPDQQAIQLKQLNQDFYKELSTSSNQIITDPKARMRYNQLNLQSRGFNAFEDPLVQQRLALTPEQRQSIDRYQQEWSKSMNELRNDFTTDREGAAKRYNELRRRDWDRVEKVLTEQQRQTWREMVGERFDFPPTMFFPPASQQQQQPPIPPSK
jgi:hypothetical protein